MFATRDGNATVDAQSFARIEKAFEELESQQKDLKNIMTIELNTTEMHLNN
jgi:hypothetical protein